MRAAGAGVERNLAGVGDNGFACVQRTKRYAVTLTERRARGTGAVDAPVAECVFHESIFTGVIGHHQKETTGSEPVAQRGQRA
jgi:hypothetical protein